MEKKEDRRITLTKRMLKEALIDILKEKDIYHISIRELCERADINRTTFYKYYGSQFDLLTDMENDMLNFIVNTIERNDSSDQEKIIYAVCKYIENNIEFCRLIISNNVDPDFAGKLFSLDSIKTSAFERLQGVQSDPEMEYKYNFLTYGAFRVMCIWLNKDEREEPEVISKLIYQMIVNG